jgi:hypothetical protein
VASLSLLLPACTWDASDEATSSVSLELIGSSSAFTDAIIDGEAVPLVEAAMVTIDQIYLQPADGSEVGRVVLRDEPITTDLLTLSHTTAKIVEGKDIPQGRYSELRFVISGAYLDVTAEGIYATPEYDQVPSGETVIGELKTPSFDTSGLKVKLPSDDLFDRPGLHQIVLVRFDVSESFGHATGSGGWVMHPVIEAESLDTTSRIILDLDARPLIDVDATLVDRPLISVLWDGGGFVEMTTDLLQTEEPGRFRADFPYLFADKGPYRLTLQTADGRPLITEPPLPDSLTISADAKIIVESTVTAVAP